MSDFSVNNSEAPVLGIDTILQIMEYSSDAILIFDDRKNISRYNRAFANLVEKNEIDLKGKPVSNILPFLNSTLIQDVFLGKKVKLSINNYPLLSKKISSGVVVPLNQSDQFLLGLVILNIKSDFNSINTATTNNNILNKISQPSLSGSWEVDLLTNQCKSSGVHELLELNESININYRNLLNYIHIEDLNLVKYKLKNISTQKTPVEFQGRVISDTGSLKYAYFKLTPIVGENEQIIKLKGFCQDITDKKKLENLLNGIFDTLTEGVIVFNPIRDSKSEIIDFEFLFLNSSSELYLEKSLDDLKGKKLCHLYPGIKKEGLFSFLKNVITTGNTTRKEFYYCHEGFENWLMFVAMKFEDSCVVTFQDFTDTMLTLEEMKKNQSFLYSSQEAGDVGSFEWDINNGKLLRYTPQFCKIMFLEQGKEYMFNDFLEKVVNEDRPLVKNTIEKIISGSSQCELEFRVSDGIKLRYCWARAVSLNEPSSNPRFIGSIVDISRRKQIEFGLEKANIELEDTYHTLKVLNNNLEEIIKQRTEELSESNERFRLISKATNDSMWDWNFETNDMWFSEAFTENFGFKNPGISIGYEFWKSCIHPDDRCSVLKGIENTIKSKGESWKHEYRFLKSDGNYTLIMDRAFIIRDINNKPVRMVGAMIEASDITIIEQRLKESEESYRFLAESMPQLLWITNEKGEGLYANKGWINYTGISFEHFKLSGWINVIHGDELIKIKNIWSEHLQSGDEFNTECRLKNKNGEYRWFLTRAISMKDNKGNIVKWIGTSTDIHDQKLLTENLAEAKRNLLEFNKELYVKNEKLRKINKDLDSFVYAASHDLRSPVRNIESLTILLTEALRQEPKNDKINYFIDLLQKSANKLNETILDLTEITKIEDTEEGEEVNFKELLEDVKLGIKDLLDNNHVRIVCKFDATGIRFSRKHIRSIFYNLLTNSIKYRSPRRLPEIEIETKFFQKDMIMISFKDNGIGIRKEDIDKVFLPFKRINYQVEGTGIGMSIVKRIIENNGGNIELESKVDAGTTFKIFLLINN